jgi:hypothetical protein
MKHYLKIWPQYYCRVADGSKTFEVRKNDRGFQPGDEVVLKEFDPDKEKYYDTDYDAGYTTKGHYTQSVELIFKIGYVLPIDAERVVFSLLSPKEKSGEG